MTSSESAQALPKPTEEDRRTAVAARIQTLGERLGREIDEILNLLAEDLPKYVQRQVKASFLADPDWAETQTEPRIREIKAATELAGREAAANIMESLRDREIWMDPEGVPEAWGTRLEDNPRVWGHILKSSEFVTQVLENFRFPQRCVSPYRVPAWLARGRLLRQAADAYWRDAGEYWALLHHRDNGGLHARVDRLSEFWDGVGKE